MNRHNKKALATLSMCVISLTGYDDPVPHDMESRATSKI
jgi:hypothetical protein